MSNIPTAEDLILTKVQYPKLMDDETCITVGDVKSLMIECAKLHCEAALKTQKESIQESLLAFFDGMDNNTLDNMCDIIVKDNSYPLDLIK